MDKEVKARLRAVVHLEGIKNKEIAQKMGYSEIHVGKSLSHKYDVLTEKFIVKFFEAFPEVAAKHKAHILNGENNLFGGDTEMLKKTIIEQNAIISELRKQIKHYRDVFEVKIIELTKKSLMLI